jgi:colanic acid biosynthesis glycosyl transferase WcaI
LSQSLRITRAKDSGTKSTGHDVAPRVWVASELYYPEDTSTGYFLTGIAEGLARGLEVTALTAQPTYAARGRKSPTRERVGGVDVRRCWSTTFPKDSSLLRLVNVATISLSFFLAGLRWFRRGDVVIVVTNPPTLPFLIWIAARWRGARFILLIHDVYPEVLVATGLIGQNGLIARTLAQLVAALYARADRIVVLGRDMKEIVLSKCPSCESRIWIIPNWADTSEIRPAPKSQNPILRELNLVDRFVVLYAGNIGRTQGMEALIEAAGLLRERQHFAFLIAGEGAKRAWVEKSIVERKLGEVRLLPRSSRSDLGVLLGACDAAVISMMPGMKGISVPSRLYNVLAAGRPILAVAEPGSELARIVIEEGVGRVVAPGDGSAIASAIIEMSQDKETLFEMGERGRAAAVGKYSYLPVLDQFRHLIGDVVARDG